MKLAPDSISPEGEATKALLQQRLRSLRIDVMTLRLNLPVYFASLQHYCTVTRTRMEDALQGGSRDGLTVRREQNGGTIYLVLYNEAVQNPRRRNFTLAHELGHIVLAHGDDGPEQEQEANRFAAQLLLPQALVRAYARQLNRIPCPEELGGLFFVSRQAASFCLERMDFEQTDTLLDQRLIQKYRWLLPRPDEPLVTC